MYLRCYFPILPDHMRYFDVYSARLKGKTTCTRTKNHVNV